MRSPRQQTTWQDDIRPRGSPIFLTFFSTDETKEYFSLLRGRHVHVVAAALLLRAMLLRHRYVTTYLSNLFANMHFFFLQSSKTSLSGWKNFFLENKWFRFFSVGVPSTFSGAITQKCTEKASEKEQKHSG